VISITHSLQQYKKFRYKSECFGRSPFLETGDYGQARMSIKKRISMLESDYKQERSGLRRQAIRDVINSLEFLMK
jgi:hypothetical protein